MIQYRKSDGTLGEFDSDKLYSLSVKDNVFIVTLRHYGWDEYDWWNEEITDIVELRIR